MPLVRPAPGRDGAAAPRCGETPDAAESSRLSTRDRRSPTAPGSPVANRCNANEQDRPCRPAGHLRPAWPARLPARPSSGTSLPTACHRSARSGLRYWTGAPNHAASAGPSRQAAPLQPHPSPRKPLRPPAAGEPGRHPAPSGPPRVRSPHPNLLATPPPPALPPPANSALAYGFIFTYVEKTAPTPRYQHRGRREFVAPELVRADLKRLALDVFPGTRDHLNSRHRTISCHRRSNLLKI